MLANHGERWKAGRGRGTTPLCVCVCVGVCAIIVLTAFGQFSAAFLGGQQARRCAMTAVDAAATRCDSTQLVVVAAAVVVALSAPASTPI